MKECLFKIVLLLLSRFQIQLDCKIVNESDECKKFLYIVVGLPFSPLDFL